MSQPRWYAIIITIIITTILLTRWSHHWSCTSWLATACSRESGSACADSPTGEREFKGDILWPCPIIQDALPGLQDALLLPWSGGDRLQLRQQDGDVCADGQELLRQGAIQAWTHPRLLQSRRSRFPRRAQVRFSEKPNSQLPLKIEFPTPSPKGWACDQMGAEDPGWGSEAHPRKGDLSAFYLYPW